MLALPEVRKEKRHLGLLQRVYEETKIFQIVGNYRGADKSLDRPGRKKLQRQKFLMLK